MLDAVIVGSGPNGLAAAITLARAGLHVEVFEGAASPGGAVRTIVSAEGTPFDSGSAVYPFAPASKFFREWQAMRRVDFVTPEISYAHPLDNGDAAVAYRDLSHTATELGSAGAAWSAHFTALARTPAELADVALSPVAISLTRPTQLTQLAVATVRSLALAQKAAVTDTKASALLAGVATHAAAPLDSIAAACIGTSLAALAHAGGWPLPRGGAQALTDAMVADFEAHGGRIHLERRITRPHQLPPARAVLFDTSPREALRILGNDLPRDPRRRLRARRRGPGVFKLDLALSEPVPWLASVVGRAASVHVGGSAEELHAAERDVARGRIPQSPFVMVVQPTAVDPARAPDKHVLWAYTRLPQRAAHVDVTESMLRQIERFAPGFRDTIRETITTTPHQLQSANPNLQGGDILGGSTTGVRFVRRPTFGSTPWRIGVRGAYLCSSAVTPGPGVHGMTGYHAAADALRTVFGRALPDLAPDSTN